MEFMISSMPIMNKTWDMSRIPIQIKFQKYIFMKGEKNQNKKHNKTEKSRQRKEPNRKAKTEKEKQKNIKTEKERQKTKC